MTDNNNNSDTNNFSREEILKLCYETFGVESIEEGNQKSISFFREAFDKKCDDLANEDDFDETEKKLKAALQTIEEEKSLAKRAAHFFLNLTASQQRWTILMAATWISIAMLCIFFGIAIKVDCDNDCQRESSCKRITDVLACDRECTLDNWNKSLFGIFLLDTLLGIVCLVIMIITFAEFTKLCGEDKCNHRHTFKMPARIAIFTACACCLLGSLFGVLKLSAESGGVGPDFLTRWDWQYCYAFGYIAYAIIWGAYLLDLWVSDFAKSADRNALPDSLRYLGGTIGFVSSLCPLAFFIVVGINVDRHWGDKFDGFKLVSPLLVFFALRCISSLIVPFSNCYHHKWEHEADTIVKKAATMILLYICGILGFVFSALTVNESDTSCAQHVTWKWIYAVIPLVVFTFAMLAWSLLLMILLCVNEEKGIQWYNKMTITVIDLLQHQQVADFGLAGDQTPANSAPNFQNNNNNNNNNSKRKLENPSFNNSTPLIDKTDDSSSPNSNNQLAYRTTDDADQI